MFTVAQITVYLGKRDFVDHVSEVDPIGEWREREGGGREEGRGKEIEREGKRDRERGKER